MADLVAKGVEVVAPPIMWCLITLENGEIGPSAYADEDNATGLKIITWTLERSGLLEDGGEWYYQVATPLVFAVLLIGTQIPVYSCFAVR